MKDFTLPSNIKQIGSIGDGLRIYMEDYVCTFLQQYAESAGFEERLAFLVGRHMVIDGQSFLFIGGAVHGKHVEKHDGHLRFTDKSVTYTDDMIEEHFPGMEIVGWMQSQPSYGTYLNQHYGAYHLRQFRRAHQVLFVMDPLDRTNAFYVANPVALTPTDRMSEITGYFVYYEKNTNMHEYMLANKAVDYTTKSPTLVELTPMEYAASEQEDDRYNDEPRITRGGYEPDDEPEDELEQDGFVTGYDDDQDDRLEGRFSYAGRPRDKHDTDQNPSMRRHQSASGRGTAADQKRSTNLLAGLCAVLFVVTFVMGVGLIRSQDRIERMEGEMRQLTTAWRNQFAENANSAQTFAEVPQVQQPPANVFEEATIPVTGNEPVPSVQYTTLPSQETPPVVNDVQPTPTPIAGITPAHGDQEALIAPVPETYTIQPGDSLIAISLYFFGTSTMVDAILELNGIEDPDMIVAGRTIALPRR